MDSLYARLRLSSIAMVKEVLEALVAVVKVGVLLFLRIFLMPIALGTVRWTKCVDLSLDISLLFFIGGLFLRCLNSLVEYSTAEWVAFSVSNVVGLLSLAWVLGISYMLVVTLSVLQLREVMHPEILAKVIRPQVSDGQHKH